MKLLLIQNGQAIYDLLKEINDTFKNNCGMQCSRKCQELHVAVEAVLDAVEDRVYIQTGADVNRETGEKEKEKQ